MSVASGGYTEEKTMGNAHASTLMRTLAYGVGQWNVNSGVKGMTIGRIATIFESATESYTQEVASIVVADGQCATRRYN